MPAPFFVKRYISGIRYFPVGEDPEIELVKNVLDIM